MKNLRMILFVFRKLYNSTCNNHCQNFQNLIVLIYSCGDGMSTFMHIYVFYILPTGNVVNSDIIESNYSKLINAYVR